MDNTLNFSVDLTQSDYFRFFRWHYYSRFWKRPAFLLFVVFVCVLAVYGFKTGNRVMLQQSVIFTSLVFAFLGAVLPFMLWLQAGRVLKKDPFAALTHQLTFSAGKFRTLVGTGDAVLSAADLTAVHLTKHAVYVMVDVSRAVIIPARYLNQDSLDKLEAWLAEYPPQGAVTGFKK